MNEPQPSADHPFAALGLDPVYRVGRAEVERSYLTKIASVHPDRGGSGTEAAGLNDARSCLLDPEKRANVLLTILGGKSAAEDAALPDGFLMEIMQLRQEIEEDLAGGDDAARVRWQQWASDERAKYEAEVGDVFEAFGVDGRVEALDECRAILNAWRYIERLIEQLDPGYNPAKADFS